MNINPYLLIFRGPCLNDNRDCIVILYLYLLTTKIVGNRLIYQPSPLVLSPSVTKTLTPKSQASYHKYTSHAAEQIQVDMVKSVK